MMEWIREQLAKLKLRFSLKLDNMGDDAEFEKWPDDDISNAKSGVRYNDDKLRYDLIPPEAERALAEVLTMGAKKYNDRNWEKGLSYMETVGSMRRHLADFLFCDDMDDESKLLTMKHVMWNAMAIIVFEERGMGSVIHEKTGKPLDDRPHLSISAQGQYKSLHEMADHIIQQIESER